MKTPLRVLIVEDAEFDAQVLVCHLRNGDYDPLCERVETADQLHAALENKSWDIILADYNLPNFSALEALKILQAHRLDVPFIIVSGGIGEDTAVAAMKAGAHDYVMKGNLPRLIPAVDRKLREASNRAAKRKATEALRESELRYRLLWETATDAVILIDTESKIHFANPAVEKVFGYTPPEVINCPLALLQPERLRAVHRESLRQYLTTGVRHLNWRAYETIGLCKNGREIPIEVAFSDMELQGQRWFVGFIRDITDRKKAEQVLRENQEQFRIAHDIQQHLFPKSAPALPGLDIAGASCPAEATGGDYFDYLPMRQDCLGAVIGDVTGHGVGPALLMAETRAYLRILAKNRDDPGEILTRANVVLAEDVGYERFVTLLLAKVDAQSKVLTYANAGHTAGYILNPAGQVKASLKRTGMPLGLKPDSQYTASAPMQLEPGEIVLLLTDGFEEALAPDETFFGIDRVLKVMCDHRDQPAPKIVQSLYDAVSHFTQGLPQADDLTVIVIKLARTGEA